MMTTLSRTIATLILVGATLVAVPGGAEEPSSGPTVNEVCFPAHEFCEAACDINSPDDGISFGAFLDNQACKMQCEEDLLACTDPKNRPARKFSPQKLVGPIFGMDGTPSDKDDEPASDGRPPADPSGGQGDGGGFEVHLNFGDGASLFSAD